MSFEKMEPDNVISPFWQELEPLILGSGSATRRLILEAVNIPLEIVHPHVDENAIATSLLSEQATPKEIAIALAHAKAEAVARKYPNRLVLTADQTLDCNGHLFMKPKNRADAAIQLTKLRGKAHQLHSAATLYRDENIIWAGVQSASLHMRDFSDDFLLAYLDAIGTDALKSVGSYQIEGLGAQLFDYCEGEHTTILGLPLFPVLHALRDYGALKQ